MSPERGDVSMLAVSKAAAERIGGGWLSTCVRTRAVPDRDHRRCLAQVRSCAAAPIADPELASDRLQLGSRSKTHPPTATRAGQLIEAVDRGCRGEHVGPGGAGRNIAVGLRPRRALAGRSRPAVRRKRDLTQGRTHERNAPLNSTVSSRGTILSRERKRASVSPFSWRRQS